MRNVLFWAGAAAAILAAAALFSFWETPLHVLATVPTTTASPVVVLDGQTIQVTIAQDDATRELGLGGRTGLGSHEGMLFVFQQDGYYAFWMKDMKFSIDMVWFSADGTVVYIQPDVSPSTYPDAFKPSVPERYVLELPAGFAAQYNVHVGDRATLP